MGRKQLSRNVFDESVDRMLRVYRGGHRVVVSFSGGKDSTAALEICILAARETGRLPVEAICRDEEIMFPGTFEYVARTAARPEVDLHWIYACQPIVNLFNRERPFWWVFDPQLPPEAWVRQPPEQAYRIPDLNIEAMTTPARFPPPPGKDLYAVIGLRTAESMGRMYGLFSSGGYLTKPNRLGVRGCRPVYDWTDGDLWRAHGLCGWDYNNAYDVMHRLGVSKVHLRIAPPTMDAGGTLLSLAQAAWPKWFDRVAIRCPGIRTAAQFGRRAVQPERQLGETWQACFHRACIETAPQWIADRATMARDRILRAHGRHSTVPLPESRPCYTCDSNIGSWRTMTKVFYNGDPFRARQHILPQVEPEFFREGAGTWGGKPGF